MRKLLIAGNWKMHQTKSEVIAFFEEIQEYITPSPQVEKLICPVYVHIDIAVSASKHTDIQIGAQNMHPKSSGAFTGEVSPLQLADIGCSHVILGHSERRQYFSETNAFINEKIKSALMHGLIPILCVGETLDERKAGLEKTIVKKQLAESLKDISETAISNVVIAYEPVWAIGTGETATPSQAQSMHKFIRTWLFEEYELLSENIQILYGGSMKPENASELLSQKDIDGGLIGGASLKPSSFAEIVKTATGLV